MIFLCVDIKCIKRLAGFDSSYFLINNKLSALFRDFLRHYNLCYDRKRGCYDFDVAGSSYRGDLRFIKPALYFHQNHSGYLSVTPFSEEVSYLFFMYGKVMETVSGISVAALVHNGTLSISDTTTTSMYNDDDLVRSFLYQTNNTMIIAYDVQNNTITTNSYARSLFLRNLQEVKTTIIQGFKALSTECNLLKNLTIATKEAICEGYFDNTEQDYLIKYLVCMEVLHLAASEELCPAKELVIDNMCNDLR